MTSPSRPAPGSGTPPEGTPDPEPLRLLPVNPDDPVVTGILSRPTSPRFMHAALALARRGFVVRLVRGGGGMTAPCVACGRIGPATLRVLFRARDGSDRTALLVCDVCGELSPPVDVADLVRIPGHGLQDLPELY